MPDEPPTRRVPCDDFRVGDWLVQPSLDRLCRGDVVVHLRPQLVDLLQLLARHPGRPVPKHVILEEVWESQYVGASALTRCIAELRQAFDDNAREPEILETIPKRGYRLIAPVHVVPSQTTGSGAAAAAAAGYGDGRVEGEAAGTQSPAAGASSLAVGRLDGVQVPVVSGAPASSGANNRGQTVRGIAMKAAVAVSLAATLGGGNWRGHPLSKERVTALVADVSNTTNDHVFDETLRLALAVQLERAPFLRIVSQHAVRGGAATAGRADAERVVRPLAEDLCRRQAADVLLAGSIAPLGTRYAVGIEALACGTGDSLGRAIEEADDKEHVLAALERAAARLRAKLGESAASLLLQHGAAERG